MGQRRAQWDIPIPKGRRLWSGDCQRAGGPSGIGTDGQSPRMSRSTLDNRNIKILIECCANYIQILIYSYGVNPLLIIPSFSPTKSLSFEGVRQRSRAVHVFPPHRRPARGLQTVARRGGVGVEWGGSEFVLGECGRSGELLQTSAGGGDGGEGKSRGGGPDGHFDVKLDSELYPITAISWNFTTFRKLLPRPAYKIGQIEVEFFCRHRQTFYLKLNIYTT